MSIQPMLDIDYTGTNPDNRIENEPHVLDSPHKTRSVVPRRGAFYASGLEIYAGSTLLSRGTQYQLVELHQELTLKTGKEIYSVILILDKDLGTSFTISYQTVGGLYTNSDALIGQMYESVMNDNRPIEWNAILNKPSEFDPTNHRHLLDDLYGFEPVVDYLERIKRALTLGQADIALEIVKKTMSQFDCSELPKVLPSSKMMRYDAFLYFLSRRKILSPITIDRTDCEWRKGLVGTIVIDTTDVPPGQDYYWEFYKENGDEVNLFSQKGGWVTSNGENVYVTIFIPNNPSIQEDSIYLGLKNHPDDPEYLAVSYLIELKEAYPSTSAYGYIMYQARETSLLSHRLAEYTENNELRTWYLATHMKFSRTN